MRSPNAGLGQLRQRFLRLAQCLLTLPSANDAIKHVREVGVEPFLPPVHFTSLTCSDNNEPITKLAEPFDTLWRAFYWRNDLYVVCLPEFLYLLENFFWSSPVGILCRCM